MFRSGELIQHDADVGNGCRWRTPASDLLSERQSIYRGGPRQPARWTTRGRWRRYRPATAGSQPSRLARLPGTGSRRRRGPAIRGRGPTRPPVRRPVRPRRNHKSDALGQYRLQQIAGVHGCPDSQGADRVDIADKSGHAVRRTAGNPSTLRVQSCTCAGTASLPASRARSHCRDSSRSILTPTSAGSNSPWSGGTGSPVAMRTTVARPS